MGVAIASFSNFGHQGHSLLVWFPDKSAASMVNEKNVVGKIFFSLL